MWASHLGSSSHWRENFLQAPFFSFPQPLAQLQAPQDHVGSNLQGWRQSLCPWASPAELQPRHPFLMAPGGRGALHHSQGQTYLQPSAGSPLPLPCAAAPWPLRASFLNGGITLEGAAVMVSCMGKLAGLLSSVEVKTLPPCIPSCCQQPPGALGFLFWCHSLVAHRGLQESQTAWEKPEDVFKCFSVHKLLG